MRTLILAAVATLAFAGAAPVWAAGPIAGGASLGMDAHFALDANGRCHAANGQLAAADKCKPAQCRDPKTGQLGKCERQGRKAGGSNNIAGKEL